MSRPVDAVIAAGREFLGDRLTTNAGLRDHHSHGQDTQPPVAARRRRLRRNLRGGGTAAGPVPHRRRAGGAVRHRHLARGPRHAGARRHQPRSVADDGGARSQPGRHGLPRAGRRHPPFAQRASARPGSVLPGRSRCRRIARRHVRDPRLRHHAVRYGTIRENVLGLTVVLADGRIIRTGGRVRKSAAGYDLTRLFIGSEGTLGVDHRDPVAAARHSRSRQRRDLPVPHLVRRGGDGDRGDADWHAGRADRTARRCADGRLHRLFEAGRPGGRCRRCSSNSTARRLVSPSRRKQAEEIAAGFDASGFHWATDADERNRLWRARHDAYWACLALKPGHQGIATDAIVPISRLAEAILGAKEDIAASGLTAPIVGHVGDGNFHTVILVPPEPDGLRSRLGARQARSSPARWRSAARAAASTGWASASGSSSNEERGRRGAGGDALGEDGTGSAGHSQSGKDLPELTARGSAPSVDRGFMKGRAPHRSRGLRFHPAG